MSDLETVRSRLAAFLSDMAALKPFLDVAMPESDEFTLAFKAARENARVADREYVRALSP